MQMMMSIYFPTSTIELYFFSKLEQAKKNQKKIKINDKKFQQKIN